MHKTITVPQIGAVLITKKASATRITLKIHPEKGVMVTIPKYASFVEAEKFVYKNIDWIKDKRQVIDKRNQSKLFNPETIFKTRQSELKFYHHDKENVTCKIKSNELAIFYNSAITDFNDSGLQDFIKKVIQKSLKYEAETYIYPRIVDLSKRINLPFKSIKIGTGATRLGSCSSKNDIIISCRLMLFPDHLIDYIIVHELCHTVHKDHSANFHNLLNKLTNGKSSSLNGELKSYTSLIVPGDFSFDVAK